MKQLVSLSTLKVEAVSTLQNYKTKITGHVTKALQ